MEVCEGLLDEAADISHHCSAHGKLLWGAVVNCLLRLNFVHIACDQLEICVLIRRA